jgi:hypothetical protein
MSNTTFPNDEVITYKIDIETITIVTHAAGTNHFVFSTLIFFVFLLIKHPI